MAVWFVQSGIVSDAGSLSRWVPLGTEDRKTRNTAPVFPLFSGAVFVAVTTVLIFSALPVTTGLLSFFSVDQIQRTDLNQTRSGGMLGSDQRASGESSGRTMGESRRKALEKPFGNISAGGGHAPWKNNRRDARRSGGGGCDNRMKSQRQLNCENLNKKQKSDSGVRMEEVKGHQLTWDDVTILDEKDFTHEVDTGRTRIRYLPDGRQVSAFLNRGMNGRFLFINSVQNESISIVITPCNSILVGTISLLPSSSTGKFRKIYVAFKRNRFLESFRTEKTLSYRISNTEIGVYLIELRPVYSDTYVYLFTTASPSYDDPFDLSWSSSPPNDDLSLTSTSSINSKTGRLHFYNFLNLHNANPPVPWMGVKRLRGDRVQVKWDPCPVNPHRMTYCIVVNSRRDYNSLCGAKGDKFGILPPDLTHLPIYQFYPPQGHTIGSSAEALQGHGSVSSSGQGERNHIVMGCVRKKTSYIISDLQQGSLYYFNVFVKDSITGLTYPYVRTMLKYRMSKPKSNLLRDAKSIKTKLGPDPVTFEFNVKKPCSELTIYLMPCGGGAIDYQIIAANRTIYEASTIDSLDIVKMAFPLRATYYITIGQAVATKDEIHNQARMVEIFVSKKQKKFPLPKLPMIRTITELENQRGCDTVTIQWYPSLDFRDNEYCIFLKEDRTRTGDASLYFKKPNQCDVERSLLNDPYVVLSYCTQKVATEKKLLNERIRGLRPSTAYVVQMIVKRHNGKSALSYDLAYVLTTSKCLDE